MTYKSIHWAWVLLLTLCTFAPVIHGQDITLRGIVSDRDTDRPLELANITLQMILGEETQSRITDNNGMYEFNRLQVGEYQIMVRYVGYETFRDTLILDRSEQNLLLNVRLRRLEGELGEVIISGERDEDLAPGQVKVSPEDFSRVPTPAGSADLAGYLQTQPGVVATGDRGGQLFVRGGTPSENLVLVDGTMIYQPFHIVGFFSVFPEDVISTVDFYAGGFGPRYSSRTSSVMDVRLKNGNLYDYQWSASASPFVSDLVVEGPVKEGRSSMLVSLRGSTIETASEIYLDEQQPLRFNSQLLKYSTASEDGLNCSLLLMRTYDRGKLDFEQGDSFKWNNLVTGGRCAGVSTESSVAYMSINFGVSRFSNDAASSDKPGRFSRVSKSHLDFNLTQYLWDIRFDYGFFTNFRSVNYDIANLFVSIEKGGESLLSTGGYLNFSIPLGDKVLIDSGLAFTSYLNQIPGSLEPRFQFSWQPRGKIGEEIHAAAGIYRQPLFGLTDYRDAGTAFSTWTLIPDENRRMEARHALIGWRQPVGRFIDFSIEGYYKEMRDTPVSTWSTVPRFSTDLAYADGTIRGVDIRLNFHQKYLYFGVGYGYALTEYETAQEHFGTWFGESIQKYNPPHDRRHQVNIQAGFERGNFKANISWIYGSGLPFTRPMGFDSYFEFREGPPDVTSDYGDPRVLLEKPFKGRMPDFHRLDISVGQAFQLTVAEVELQVGAMNLYNWKNLFYFDVFYQREIQQLPLIPYLSLKLESI